MADVITTSPPAGSDGLVPVYQPNERWSQWNMKEVWKGPGTPGTGRYVPKVGDLVIDPDTYQWYEVEALDPTTFVPVYKHVQASIPDDQISDEDRLLGAGGEISSKTMIVYIDKRTKPYTANVDGRCYVKGTGAVSMMLFKGSTTDGTGKIISAIYDTSGNLVSQAVPLEEKPYYDDQGTYVGTCKVPLEFNTTEDLQDNEIVTAVFFSATARVVSKSQLFVQNSGFTQTPNNGVKYVQSVSLESPFLSEADPDTLKYPLNVPLNGLNLMGVVNFSDGTKRRLPVDNTRFSLFGLNNGFVATVIGQKVPLVLKYLLAQGEYGMSTLVNGDRFIAREYEAITLEADGQYTVKLFGFPVWVDAVQGYRLEWFLFNLDRSTMYRVTPYVQYLKAFNPIGYGVRQQLQMQINLKDVNGTYKNFLFTQTISISLLNQGTERSTNWTVQFAPGQSPEFGVNNFAASTFINQNLYKVNLAMGETDVDVWLERAFWRTLPLFDSQKEAKSPAPTHFAVLQGADWIEFPISQWNQDLKFNQAITNSGTLFVKFFHRTVDNDLQLSVAGFPIYQQN